MNGKAFREIYVGDTICHCQITHNDNIYHYRVGFANEVAEQFRNNGMEVLSVNDSYTEIDVDHDIYHFKGDKYVLNQCEDLFQWFEDSKVCEFTYYYNDRIVFHSPDGHFYSSYWNDINNYIMI